jgi:hypothetical protein
VGVASPALNQSKIQLPVWYFFFFHVIVFIHVDLSIAAIGKQFFQGHTFSRHIGCYSFCNITLILGLY